MGWLNPHVVILDEPTNYLDRDGLGALVRGLEAYKGGVVIISHNTEFTDSVCTQKWVMLKDKVTGAGRLTEEGAIIEDTAIDNADGPDEVFDEAGNKTKVEKKMNDMVKAKTDDTDDYWELHDRVAELKAEL